MIIWTTVFFITLSFIIGVRYHWNKRKEWRNVQAEIERKIAEQVAEAYVRVGRETQAVRAMTQAALIEDALRPHKEIE